MQIAAADDGASSAREAKRTAEAAAAEATFQLSQSERRCNETREVALALEERADAIARRLRAAERANAEQEAHAKDWEARLVDADHALSLSEAKALVRLPDHTQWMPLLSGYVHIPILHPP
jgi:hypothetical protein